MNRLYYYTNFYEKSTGKLLHILKYPVITERGVTDPYEILSLNKFFYEKEKAVIIEKLIKDRFIDRGNILVKDGE